MKKILLLMSIGFLVVLLTQCKKDPEIPSSDAAQFFVPKGWKMPVYNFEENAQSSKGFELGKKLFYDKKLSRDGTVSCGSCHQQFAGFSHAAHSLSHGIEGNFGKRNAPALSNLAWHPYFMWDGGINHITVQPLAPIQDPLEMGADFNDIVNYLSSNEDYLKKFKDVFGSEEINTQRILKALTQFTALLISSNSKYDKYSRQEDGITLSTEENEGLQLFNKRCNVCHTAPLFTNYGFVNIGLQPNLALQDSGRMRITQVEEDKYCYKVPSLRNVEFSSPYMHDGRFKTLDKAIDYHFNKIYSMPNVSPILLNGNKLSTDEITKIIAFLKTLSDYEFLKDKRFSEP